MSLHITYTFVLKSAFGNQIGVYKHPLPLYTKMNQTFIYFEWEGPFYDEMEASKVSRALRAGELDSKGYAIRIRRSPKHNHAIDVVLDKTAGGFW